MNWMEQMTSVQKELVKQSPHPIEDDVYDAVMLFRKARHDVVMRGGESAHISPFWTDAELIMLHPVNPSLVRYLALNGVAERMDIPLTWLYLMPHSINIDSAARQVNFSDGAIRYTDKEGYAQHECVLAHHDGVMAGLIDKDEPLPFARSPFAEEYELSVNEVIDKVSAQYGVTDEQALCIMQGKHIDAPFPCENDDSPWGDA